MNGRRQIDPQPASVLAPDPKADTRVAERLEQLEQRLQSLADHSAESAAIYDTRIADLNAKLTETITELKVFRSKFNYF